jgi:hypothetical protein
VGRTLGFDGIIRALRLAKAFEDRGISTKEGLERAALTRERHRASRTTAAAPSTSRRDVLKGIGANPVAIGGRACRP